MMNDKIESLDESSRKDRSKLNVGGRTKNNKIAVVVAFVFVAFIVLASGLYFAFKNASEIPGAEQIPVDNNFIAGANVSSLDDSNDYFESIRRNKKRKEEIEQSKAIKAEQEKKELEEKKSKQENPVKVKRVKRTVSRDNKQPEPKAKRSSRSSNKKKTPTPKQRKMQGSVLIGVKSKTTTITKPPKSFSKSFNAFAFEDGQAGLRNKGSLDFLLIHGTSLPCALYTQIISDYEGYVTCRITEDIYSANGAALLIEKGSLVSGTQSVALEQGKSRIFTSWGDVETPLGVSIRIDSLGTGQLGASGIDAWVDNHYEERFGGAILLSFIDDALGALSEKISGGDGADIDNSTDNASDMASKALDSSINIKPTGYAFIGQKINILVARDIDMSSVYRFEEE